jgi:uncharacterized membrane protein YeaQ/YmgE (transglycosylase-associated protein family)
MDKPYVIILIAAVIGLVTGWLAELMTGRRHGLISTLATGLTGSFLGAFIANVMETSVLGMWTSPAFAATGAVFLLLTLALVRRRA